MKRSYFLFALVVIIFIAYSLYTQFFADKIAINKLLKAGILAVENENLAKIETFLSINCENRSQLLNEARKYFQNFEPMSIKIVKKIFEIENDSVKTALLLLITSTFESMGKVTGRETVGLEFKRKRLKDYRGWRIIRVEFSG